MQTEKPAKKTKAARDAGRKIAQLLKEGASF
jgi:hypothetical protein